MNKKPRIAFCFSGQARTLDQTYLFFQKNLFDSAKEQGFDFDVFCAVEDDVDTDKVKLLNPTKVEKIKSSDVEKIIEKKFGSFIDNEMYLYSDTLTPGITNILQQCYKVQESIKLAISNYNKYDIVFKLRFDCFFFNKLNLLTILDTVKTGRIIANGPNSDFGSRFCSYLKLEDLFFIGNFDGITVFQDLFDNFKDTMMYKRKRQKKFNKILIKLKYICYNKGFPLSPINFLQRILGVDLYVGDSYYYKFLLFNNKLLKISKISLILLRKDIKKSWIQLYDKSLYEL